MATSNGQTTTTTAALAQGSTPTTAHGVDVRVEKNAKFGEILVNSAGFTLYRYARDARDKSNCGKAGGCLAFWPPALLPVGATSPLGAAGIAGLGTIRRAGGRLQLTYNGMPLYTFVEDHSPGQVNGQGFEGVWFVVTVSKTPHEPGSTTTTVAPTTSTAGGGTPTTGVPTTMLSPTTTQVPTTTQAPTTTERPTTTTSTTTTSTTTTTTIAPTGVGF